ncbi:type II toxin-antitoxin system RelE/ParE family toxin [uncultured Parabacteroides sp.]|jgi:mRNA-degrading endonuclease RelE of RelBE toxin-antitoxin system|uniref:type II toxin-antitoxin system RelE/ParE family toxin n=1 Tax=uncultured Parabacteroides sp. TaxID=512312 RepID=UPI0025F89AC0|nr:type II toxin-antitoxin system RelE/ParE family toxin [uncultured Parabacteroides sp.]
MNYSIVTAPSFLRELKRLSKKYRSLKKDLISLQDELLENPEAGADLGRGIRKVRMAIGSKGRGKSHGARVITVTMIVDEESSEIVLLFIYDKAEQSSISITDIEKLIKENNLPIKE